MPEITHRVFMKDQSGVEHHVGDAYPLENGKGLGLVLRLMYSRTKGVVQQPTAIQCRPIGDEQGTPLWEPRGPRRTFSRK